MNNQQKRVYDYMKEFGSITSHQAFLDLGITRLAARVHELRTQGYDIESETIPVDNRFKETCHISKYWIAEKKGQLGLF